MHPPAAAAAPSSSAAPSSAHPADWYMYVFKVRPCYRSYPHNWSICPYTHPGEKARRRDPRTHSYRPLPCPHDRKGSECPQGDACTYTHNVYEFWLHPMRFRTQLCQDADCRRPLCFFAHGEQELRRPDVSTLQQPAALGEPPQQPQQQSPAVEADAATTNSATTDMLAVLANFQQRHAAAAAAAAAAEGASTTYLDVAAAASSSNESAMLSGAAAGVAEAAYAAGPQYGYATSVVPPAYNYIPVVPGAQAAAAQMPAAAGMAAGPGGSLMLAPSGQQAYVGSSSAAHAQQLQHYSQQQQQRLSAEWASGTLLPADLAQAAAEAQQQPQQGPGSMYAVVPSGRLVPVQGPPPHAQAQQYQHQQQQQAQLMAVPVPGMQGGHQAWSTGQALLQQQHPYHEQQQYQLPYHQQQQQVVQQHYSYPRQASMYGAAGVAEYGPVAFSSSGGSVQVPGAGGGIPTGVLSGPAAAHQLPSYAAAYSSSLAGGGSSPLPRVVAAAAVPGVAPAGVQLSAPLLGARPGVPAVSGASIATATGAGMSVDALQAVMHQLSMYECQVEDL